MIVYGLDCGAGEEPHALANTHTAHEVGNACAYGVEHKAFHWMIVGVSRALRGSLALTVAASFLLKLAR